MIHALTVASKKTEGLKFLRESAALQGWDLKILWAPKWDGALTKLRTLQEWLRKGPAIGTDRVFFVDAFDCYAQRPLEDLPSIESGRFLISGHKRCFPPAPAFMRQDGRMERIFPDCAGGYRYLCGGAWLADAATALMVVNHALHNYGDESWEQAALMKTKADGLPIDIDHEGRMAFTVFKEDLGIAADGIFNLATQTRPVVVHGNNGTWREVRRGLVRAGIWKAEKTGLTGLAGCENEKRTARRDRPYHGGKMTLSKKQVFSADFQRAFAKLMATGLGFKTNIALAKAARVIQEEQEAFQKATLAQLERFEAVREEDGWRFASIDKKAEFEREQQAAALEEIDLGLERIKLPKNCELPAETLAPLLELLDLGQD